MRLITAVLVVIATGACSPADDGGTSPSTDVAPTVSTFPVWPSPESLPPSEQILLLALPGMPEEAARNHAEFHRADEYLGLTEGEAIALAVEQRREARLVYRDEFLGHEDDLSAFRVNLYVVDGEVVEARLF